MEENKESWGYAEYRYQLRSLTVRTPHKRGLYGEVGIPEVFFKFELRGKATQFRNFALTMPLQEYTQSHCIPEPTDSLFVR